MILLPYPSLRYNSTGYAAEASGTYNQQQQQQYYNYYYQQYPAQATGYYNQAPPTPGAQSSVPETPGEVVKQTPPDQPSVPPATAVVASAESSNIETVDMEMENETEDAPSAVVVPSQQGEEPLKEVPNVEVAPSTVPQVGYGYTQNPPAAEPGSTEGVSTWTPQQPTTVSSQWYPPQQGDVASWGGGAQSGWPAGSNNGGVYYGNWQNATTTVPGQQDGAYQQQPPQQQQQQQQPQPWAGGWGQWAGQGGADNTAQWGQWQGQPGMEAWAGQAYGTYQQQPQQPGYTYPQSKLWWCVGHVVY